VIVINILAHLDVIWNISSLALLIAFVRLYNKLVQYFRGIPENSLNRKFQKYSCYPPQTVSITHASLNY